MKARRSGINQLRRVCLLNSDLIMNDKYKVIVFNEDNNIPIAKDIIKLWESNNKLATGIGVKAHIDFEEKLKLNNNGSNI